MNKGVQVCNEMIREIFSYLDWEDMIRLKVFNRYIYALYSNPKEKIITKRIIEQVSGIVENNNKLEVLKYIKSLDPGRGQKITCLLFAKQYKKKSIKISGAYLTSQEQERWRKVASIAQYEGKLVFPETEKIQNTKVIMGIDTVVLNSFQKDRSKITITYQMQSLDPKKIYTKITLEDFKRLGYRIPKYSNVIIENITPWSQEMIVLLYTRLWKNFGTSDDPRNDEKISLVYKVEASNIPKEYHADLWNLFYGNGTHIKDFENLIENFDLSWERKDFEAITMSKNMYN